LEENPKEKREKISWFEQGCKCKFCSSSHHQHTDHHAPPVIPPPFAILPDWKGLEVIQKSTLRGIQERFKPSQQHKYKWKLNEYIWETIFHQTTPLGFWKLKKLQEKQQGYVLAEFHHTKEDPPRKRKKPANQPETAPKRKRKNTCGGS